jgi:hypothetical protein
MAYALRRIAAHFADEVSHALSARQVGHRR